MYRIDLKVVRALVDLAHSKSGHDAMNSAMCTIVCIVVAGYLVRGAIC